MALTSMESNETSKTLLGKNIFKKRFLQTRRKGTFKFRLIFSFLALICCLVLISIVCYVKTLRCKAAVKIGIPLKNCHGENANGKQFATFNKEDKKSIKFEMHVQFTYKFFDKIINSNMNIFCEYIKKYIDFNQNIYLSRFHLNMPKKRVCNIFIVGLF